MYISYIHDASNHVLRSFSWLLKSLYTLFNANFVKFTNLTFQISKLFNY